MASAVKTKKIRVTHPVTGTERNFDAAIYTSFRSAIRQSLKGSEGKTFTELTGDVRKIIKKKMPAFTGSIPWYTISVRLDLETRGEVETVTIRGKKLNCLKT